MRTSNVFAGPYLDRASHMRQNAEWYAAALVDARSRVIPVWNSRSLIADFGAPHAVFVGVDVVPAGRRSVEDLILLGRVDEVAYFVYEFDSIEPPALAAESRFEDLRNVASLLPAREAGVLGYARAMVSWRRRHRFCGTCGSRTLAAKSGHVLICTDASCRTEQFPRLDPAIIVLVKDGDRALLGRQAMWPVGLYSTSAGFVEPGESLEDAVAREVFEETGVHVDTIEYHSSQPWPFPASLMLGFTARAITHAVHLHDQELEDARWFSRDDIAAGKPLLPPSQSISFRLIEHWFDEGGERRLRSLAAAAPWPSSG